MKDRPNILFMFTDQQSASMMGCSGNPYVQTPAMDSLADSGIRFERTYCTNPVCVPSRFSLMTGRMPSAIGLRSNDDSGVGNIPEEVLAGGLGWRLKAAGYDVGYGGKEHLPRMRTKDLGFDYFCSDERDGLAQACVDFINRERDKPFFLTASFINPHDICYLALRDFTESEEARALVASGVTEVEALDQALRMPEGMSRKTFFDTVCPPLPDNHAPQADEPGAIDFLLDQRPFRRNARERYTAEQWCLHRWAYCKLTEEVDRQIGRVLEGLRASGQAENTIVIFSSDHGDLDGAHRMEHKTAFYEEACRVPLIMSGPGIAAGRVSRELVSNGLDLLPTLCDFAGTPISDGLAGQSIRPLAEGRPGPGTRSYLPLESEIGRMIVTKDYKYMVYDFGVNPEQLFDLQKDPGEMHNVVADPAYEQAIGHCRELFLRQFGAIRV